MKKYLKIFYICFAFFAIIICSNPSTALAENLGIKSKGNLIFQKGENITIYFEDIQYLQKEISKLYLEIK